MNNHIVRLWFVPFVLLLMTLLSSCYGNKSSMPKEILTPEERQWLTEHQHELFFAPDPAYAPFEFYDPISQETKGLAHDFIFLIEKKLGIKFQQRRAKSFHEILDLAMHKQVAIVNAATQTPERSQYLLFTDPYVEVKNVILVRKQVVGPLSLEQLKDRRISMVKGYAITEFMLKNYPNYQYDLMATDFDVLMNVSQGAADSVAGILDLATSTYLTEREGVANLRVAGDAGYPIKLAIGSRKDWPEFHQILQKALQNITKEERERIYEQWIGLDDPSFYKSRKFWMINLILFSAFLILGAFILLWNQQLKKQVKIKTAELAKSENRYRTLFEQAGVGFAQIDFSVGRFIRVNKRYSEIVGRTNEDLIAHPLLYTTHPEDRKAVLHNIELLLQNKIENFSMEKRCVRKDGKIIWVVLTVSRMESSAEQKYYIAVIEDITSRKDAERAMIESQRLSAIGETVAGVAHDFNNVLQGIMGNIEIALFDKTVPPHLLKNLNAIKGLTQDAASRVKLLRRFCSLNVSPTNYPLIDLNEVVQDVLIQAKPLWKDQMELKGIKVTIQSCYRTLPKIPGACSEIRTAIYNILKNSLEAMPNGGTIDIETGPHTAGVFIQITDSGEGMTPETALKIFQPFFTTKGFDGGRGLGMSGVLGIMQEHNGSIQIKRTAPGEGTTIELVFPLQRETIPIETEETLPPSPREASLADGPIRVLWVDDESTIREIGQSFIQDLGQIGKTAQSGREAIAELTTASPPYDLVITDIGMEGMNGFELAHTLRKIYGPTITIAALTGWGKEVKASQIQEGDIDYILAKPATQNDVRTLFETVIALKKESTLS